MSSSTTSSDSNLFDSLEKELKRLNLVTTALKSTTTAASNNNNNSNGNNNNKKLQQQQQQQKQQQPNKNKKPVGAQQKNNTNKPLKNKPKNNNNNNSTTTLSNDKYSLNNNNNDNNKSSNNNRDPQSLSISNKRNDFAFKKKHTNAAATASSSSTAFAYKKKKPFSISTSRGPIANVQLSCQNMDDSDVDLFLQWMDRSEKVKGIIEQKQVLVCNLEMQENQFSDSGVEKLVSYLLSRSTTIQVNALKLWKNSIGDVGAQHLAKLISELPYGLVEIHLSHNRITTRGAIMLFQAIENSRFYPRMKPTLMRNNRSQHVGDAIDDSETETTIDLGEAHHSENEEPTESIISGSSTQSNEVTAADHYAPIWLRLEFNFINVELLEKEYDFKSLLHPCEASDRVKCGPNSCCLLDQSTEENQKCKVHLYVFHLQYQKPEESTLLTDAKDKIQKMKQQSPTPETKEEQSLPDTKPVSVDEKFVSDLPTYIFIDTCAILNMIDGPKFVSPSDYRFCHSFNFKSLISKALAGQFGTSLERDGDKIHLIVTDTVMQELDHRKSKEQREWLREAIRRQIQSDQGYMEKCSRMKFMTCLGAHQGELLLKSSNTSFFSTPNAHGNLYNDLKLLEVAMFWSKELGFNKNVIVLTSDYEVKRRARSHNIPAELIKNIDKSLTSFSAKNPDAPWTASVIKSCMRNVYEELSHNTDTVASHPNSIFAELEGAGSLVGKLVQALQEKGIDQRDIIEEANNSIGRWKSLIESSRNWINK